MIARNNTISPAIALHASVATGVVKGPTIDLKGINSCQFGITTPSYTTQEITVQHSDTTTDGDFVTVPVADLLGAAANPIVSPSKTLITVVHYVGAKRYVRLNRSVGTGTTVDVPAHAAIAILADLAHGA